MILPVPFALSIDSAMPYNTVPSHHVNLQLRVGVVPETHAKVLMDSPQGHYQLIAPLGSQPTPL